MSGAKSKAYFAQLGWVLERRRITKSDRQVGQPLPKEARMIWTLTTDDETNSRLARFLTLSELWEAWHGSWLEHFQIRWGFALLKARYLDCSSRVCRAVRPYSINFDSHSQWYKRVCSSVHQLQCEDSARIIRGLFDCPDWKADMLQMHPKEGFATGGEVRYFRQQIRQFASDIAEIDRRRFARRISPSKSSKGPQTSRARL